MFRNPKLIRANDTPVFLPSVAVCCSIKREGEEEQPQERALGLFCRWLKFVPSPFAETVEII